jgi:UPF0271 protein
VTKRIDINCDMGERPDALLDGTEERLMQYVTSANIACGGHAGDVASMEKTLQLARRYNVGIGAHPGYPDRANFGRREMQLSADEIASTVYEQIRTLADLARRNMCEIVHVKPHGALYTKASHDASVADAIAHGVARLSKDLILVGFAGSLMIDVWQNLGFRAVGEAFADRVYEPDGSLRSREFDDALTTDPAKAARQALTIANEGIVIAHDGTKVKVNARTICIHGDTPGAVAISRAVRAEYGRAGVEVTQISSFLEESLS